MPYNKLLLSTGGGIISAFQQSAQTNDAVLCIGLGGTGVRCLETLKGKVFNRLRPDDPDAPIREYSHIQFLAVDSDFVGFANRGTIGRINADTEFFPISNSAITAAFLDNGEILETRPEMKTWLRNQEIMIDFASTGAGGKRQVGRFLLMDRSAAFIEAIRERIKTACNNLIDPTIYVHIFAGLSGGTGSGTFLDVCYLVQHVIRDMGIAGKAQTFGYFFLPDVNLSVRDIAPHYQNQMKMNGYAAMKELDYCMGFEQNHDEWDQVYGGNIRVRSKARPVSLCHLITAQDANGRIIPNALDYAINVVSDYIMDFLVKEEPSEDDPSPQKGVESLIMYNNVAMEMIRKSHGAQYAYIILGGSSAQLPLKEIMTYLSSRLFYEFTHIRHNTPVAADVDEFVKSNGLTYERLRAAIIQGADISFPEPNTTWRHVCKEGDAKLVTGYYQELHSNVTNIIEKNKHAMLQPLASYVETENIQSVICRIFKAIKDLMLDPAKGPFFAARILNSANVGDLEKVFDGHIAGNTTIIKQVEYSMNGSRAVYDRCFAAWHAKNNQENYKAYINASQAYVSNWTTYEILSALDEVLRGVKKSIHDLAIQFTTPFERVLSTLIETFSLNYEFLQQIPQPQFDNVYQLMTIKDLIPTLNSEISGMDIPCEIRRFVEYMMNNEVAFLSERENEITRVVNEFFITLFDSYSKRTMSDYLKEKYNTNNLQLIQNHVLNDILMRLNSRSKPFLWTANAIYNLAQSTVVEFCSVPSACPEIVAAAEDLFEMRTELKLRKTDLRDRITMLRCNIGIPLFGYQGLTDCESLYCNKKGIIGRHLYEGKNGGKDWSKLPSPKPYSILSRTQSHEYVQYTARTAAALFETAQSLGIIYSDNDSFFIRYIDDDYVADIESKAAAAASIRRSEMIAELEKIKQLAKNHVYIDDNAEEIVDDSYEDGDAKLRVVKDYFVSSLMFQRFTSEQLAKLDRISEALTRLTETIANDNLTQTEHKVQTPTKSGDLDEMTLAMQEADESVSPMPTDATDHA